MYGRVVEGEKGPASMRLGLLGDIRGSCVYGRVVEEEVQEYQLGCGWKGGCAAC